MAKPTDLANLRDEPLFSQGETVNVFWKNGGRLCTATINRLSTSPRRNLEGNPLVLHFVPKPGKKSIDEIFADLCGSHENDIIIKAKPFIITFVDITVPVVEAISNNEEWDK